MHHILVLILSFIALLWAANHLVTGASGISLYFKLSPLMIGLTLTAIFTCVPQLMLSILSSLHDKNDLSIGNAIGSNIANIGLVLGITILISPTSLSYDHLKKTYPILIITMLFTYSLILDGFLGKVDGCLLLIACIIILSFFIYMSVNISHKDHILNQFKSAAASSRSLKTNICSLIIGIGVLPISAKYILISSSDLALSCGLSELTIGLTILAFSTTLPQLATAVTAALKGEEGLAIGTILGSNIYNLILVMVFPSLINQAKINPLIVWRDMPVMIALTLLLFFLNYTYKKNLSPWHGGILLLVYFSYIGSLLIKAL